MAETSVPGGQTSLGTTTVLDGLSRKLPATPTRRPRAPVL